MSDMLVFDTMADADAGVADIDVIAGFPKPGRNAATGKINPDVLTTTWAVPQERITDGKAFFPEPPDTEEIPAEAVAVMVEDIRPVKEPYDRSWLPEEMQ